MRDLNFPIADPLTRYGGFVPHPSKVIRQKTLAYLEELEQKDTHLAGELRTRAKQCIIPGWTVKPYSDDNPADREAADFVRWNLDNLDGTFYSDLEGLCTAQGFGFSLMEGVFRVQSGGRFDGRLALAKLKHIPARYVAFDFDEAGNIRPDGVVFLNRYGGRDELRYPYARFVHARFGHTDNPYGDALILRCAFWSWLKENGSKFWAVFLEKFGAPTLLTELPRNANPADVDKALEIMQRIQTDSGITVPQGFKVTLLEAMRRGDVTYDSFIDRCNKEISKIILGATLSVEGAGRGQAGGYALGKQHGSVTGDYAYADALWLEHTVNYTVIRQLVDLNFDHGRYPRFRILDDELAVMVGLAQSLQLLAATGLEIPQSWVRDRIGIPLPQPGDKILSVLPPAREANAANPAADLRLHRAGFPNPTGIRTQPPSRASSPCRNLHPSSFRLHPFPRPAGIFLPSVYGGAGGGLLPCRNHPSVYGGAGGGLLPDREQLLDDLEADILAQLQPALDELLSVPLAAISKLAEGQPVGDPPPLKANLGEIKKILTRAAFEHYCYGKAFATAELEALGVAVPAKTDPMPDLPKEFRRHSPDRRAEFPTNNRRSSHPSVYGGAGGGLLPRRNPPPLRLRGGRGGSSSFILHPSFSTSSSTPGDLLTLLARALPLTDAEIAALISLYEDRFYTVAGLIKSDVEKIWQQQVLALKDGWTLRDFTTKLTTALSDYAGPVLDGQLPAHRVELIYRNWMNQAYAEGKSALYNDPELADFIWGYRYEAILDSRVRDSHAALDGTTLPKDHEFWQFRTPPWDHNCRCDIVPITAVEIASGTVTETAVPAYDKAAGFA